MPLKVVAFLGAILLLALAYAIVTQLRRSLIKRRFPYELMLAEKAGVLFVSATRSHNRPSSSVSLFSLWPQSYF
jgi:hypothetical protein